MASFTFTLPNGQPFEVKGPPDITLEQAKAAFNQQANTGALVGFKPGDSLSAEKQLAAGLASAKASVDQALSGITGALGAKIPGSAGAIGSVNQLVSSAKSVASTATSSITKALSSTPLSNPITVSNFVKEPAALGPIGPLPQSTVTGVLAQAKNIVGQAASKLSNTKGVGSFGFDAKQLETAGILKPGTSKFITQGAASLSSVLKSPSVFTGKDGIKDVNSLLSSPQKQSSIQQGLMANGAAGLAAVGLPLNKLGSGAPGMLLNAAKSLPNATAFAKGLPLPAGVAALMNTNLKDGAFAAKLTNSKIPEAYKAEETPAPAADTVNRDTLDAASSRITGNPKIPAPSYGPKVTDVDAEIEAIKDVYSEAIGYIVGAIADLTDIKNELKQLDKQATVSAADFDAVQAAYNKAKNDYSNRGVKLISAARLFRDSKSGKAQIGTNPTVADFNKFADEFAVLVKEAKALLAAIEAKVSR